MISFVTCEKGVILPNGVCHWGLAPTALTRQRTGGQTPAFVLGVRPRLLATVIILTTFARPGYFERALKAGAHGYLLKDGSVDDLSDTIAG